MRVVLYCRVSSLSQEEKGTIRTQQEFAERYCKSNNITLVETYSDDGVSGSVPIKDRAAGSRLLADAHAKKFDTLLIYNLSRLSRDTLDALETIRFLHSQGIALKSISDGVLVDSSPMGQFVITQLAGLNQLMRDNIRTDSRRGMERCVREGRWVGGRPPFGYQVVDGRLAVEPEQSEIVKTIFTWYLSGQRVRGIAARLYALEVKHPMDWNKPVTRPWYEATVSNLLRNRCYIGEWAWRKRTDRKKVAGKTVSTMTTPDKQIKVEIPAIISREDFDRVQQTLKDNFTFSKRNARHFYLLRGLIVCACGKRYVGLGSGQPRWYKYFYRCSSHVSAVGRVPCKGKAVRADLIEPAIWAQCVEFITNPESVLDELRMTMASRQYSQTDLKAEVGQMDAALQVKARERAKVINLIRRGFISEEEGERELATVQLEVCQLQRQREDLLSQLTAAEDSELRALTAESMLELLASRISDIDDAVKREVTCLLVDQIVIKTENDRPVARVTYIFRPASLIVSQGGNSVDVSSVDPALETSSARFAETWPRTSRKSTL